MDVHADARRRACPRQGLASRSCRAPWRWRWGAGWEVRAHAGDGRPLPCPGQLSAGPLTPQSLTAQPLVTKPSGVVATVTSGRTLAFATLRQASRPFWTWGSEFGSKHLLACLTGKRAFAGH